MKFVFHIADAPPHGMKYHIGSGDIFPLGCPCKIDLDQEMIKMCKQKVNYKLCQISSNLNVFALVGKKLLNDYMEVVTLDSSISLDGVISKTIIKDIASTVYEVRK